MAVTEGGLLGGRLRFRQASDGYRAGMDAALLAAACDARPGDRVIDVGCGAGAVMLAAAARRDGAVFLGVERDPDVAELARENIGLNRLGDRVAVIVGDIARPWRELEQSPFDAALANPPFFDDPVSLRGPKPEKQGAWIADDGLAGWIDFMIRAVKQGGTLTLIHRADRLADILGALSAKAGSFQIRPIHPFADAPAKRVIVRAIKTGKAPLKLVPALVLHDHGGAKHSTAAEAIFNGSALNWD